MADIYPVLRSEPPGNSRRNNIFCQTSCRSQHTEDRYAAFLVVGSSYDPASRTVCFSPVKCRLPRINESKAIESIPGSGDSSKHRMLRDLTGSDRYFELRCLEADRFYIWNVFRRVVWHFEILYVELFKLRAIETVLLWLRLHFSKCSFLIRYAGISIKTDVYKWIQFSDNSVYEPPSVELKSKEKGNYMCCNTS